MIDDCIVFKSDFCFDLARKCVVGFHPYVWLANYELNRAGFVFWHYYFRWYLGLNVMTE